MTLSKVAGYQWLPSVQLVLCISMGFFALRHGILGNKRLNSFIALASISFALSACIPSVQQPTAKQVRVDPSAPPPPPPPFSTRSKPQKKPISQSSTALRQCMRQLDAMEVEYERVADGKYGHCEIQDAVLLRSIRKIAVPAVTVRCSMGLELAKLLAIDVPSIARRHFKSDVVGIGTLGSFVCRKVNGINEDRMSDHAFGNAIDLSSLRLKDGSRMAIVNGWEGAPNERAFWRQLRDAACERFHVVLSPDYNAAHFNHLHFDMGKKRGCR